MRRLSVLLVIGLLLVASVDCRADQGPTYHLSFRSLRLMPGERVAKFELHLHSAMIVGFRSIPVGWQINIDNDPSWITEVSGIAVVGAADLEVSKLRPWFMSVLPESDGRAGSITVEGSITLANGDHQRTIAITNRDVALVPSSADITAK